MGAPTGPVGCHAPDELPRWELGLGWSGFSTELVFGGRHIDLRQHGVSASLTRIFPTGWSVLFSGGFILGGRLSSGYVSPGLTTSIQVSRQWRGAAGAVPFVLTSLALSASYAFVDYPPDYLTDLLATDLRLSGVVGWDVAGVWSPYLALRVFGGPVWEGGGSAGSDRHHYNAAVGSRFRLGHGVSLFVDASLLGEQSLGAGAAYAW